MNDVQEKPERRSKKSVVGSGKTVADAKRSTTVLRHQELHDRLVAEAEVAIASDGLGNLRARALADAVGCSVGAIYGVFPDLDALVLAVNGRTLVAMEAAMRDAGDGSGPADHLMRLAAAYLDFASSHRPRWRALFEHRMTGGRLVPDWYAELRAASFSHIEQPLAVLCPALDAGQRMVLARSVFAAVHGVVDLGLDEKVAATPLAVLRAQLGIVVGALAAGLGPP